MSMSAVGSASRLDPGDKEIRLKEDILGGPNKQEVTAHDQKMADKFKDVALKMLISHGAKTEEYTEWTVTEHTSQLVNGTNTTYMINTGTTFVEMALYTPF